MTVTENDVVSAVEQLKRTLAEARSSFSLRDVPQLVENQNKAALVHTLATTQDDHTALDKWFSVPRDGELSNTTLSAVLVESDEELYVLVRSEMHSERKARNRQGNGDGTYHAVWIVGHDESESQDYFIHRVEWRQEFETPLSEADWSVEQIRSWLGFDEHLSGSAPEFGVKYLVQGDLTLKLDKYQEYLDDIVDSRTERQITQQKREQKREQMQQWIEQSELTDIEGIRIFEGASRITVTVSPTDTEELKNLQRRVGIDEEDIRGLMDDDWERLTAERRSRLIEQTVVSRYSSSTEKASPNREAIEDRIRRSVEVEIKDKVRQYNTQIGNHLLVIEQGCESLQPASKQDEAVEVLVPESGTTLLLLHDQHPDKKLELEKSVVSLDVLERHRRS